MPDTKRKSLIEVLEPDFPEADELARLIIIYKAKHGLRTKFQAAAEMIKATAEREGLGL